MRFHRRDLFRNHESVCTAAETFRKSDTLVMFAPQKAFQEPGYCRHIWKAGTISGTLVSQLHFHFRKHFMIWKFWHVSVLQYSDTYLLQRLGYFSLIVSAETFSGTLELWICIY